MLAGRGAHHLLPVVLLHPALHHAARGAAACAANRARVSTKFANHHISAGRRAPQLPCGGRRVPRPIERGAGRARGAHFGSASRGSCPTRPGRPCSRPLLLLLRLPGTQATSKGQANVNTPLAEGFRANPAANPRGALANKGLRTGICWPPPPPMPIWPPPPPPPPPSLRDLPICWAGIWPPGPPPPPDMLRPWSPRCCIVPLLTLHHSLRSNRHRPPPQAPPLSHR